MDMTESVKCRDKFLEKCKKLCAVCDHGIFDFIGFGKTFAERDRKDVDQFLRTTIFACENCGHLLFFCSRTLSF